MRAKHRRRIHLALMILWAPQLGAVFVMPESWQVPYLMIVSVYANFVGHWGAYSGETPTESE